ncbi:hypothetical protein PTSG_00963 [Salpingoeca rosetta]|uniref:Uncharacterized protein n=1 Tax=Salpingoeca rosetta (strain ATCC 50818 / BSB-021) TaxID=946362 RepID=F2TY01_SALR5|nr:uncharacterized protein PTSG_00963 [Salpingoeca rosetta]EGD76260.1 hypothetical protein PTSG_00963 [Salpingoeca rosetta]|eukprot:XP_004998435.1 hypothetical protein PTSG_00963 [Salpingoeca rosetta]
MLSVKAVVLMLLLAMQYAAQPYLNRHCSATRAITTSIILATEATKFVVCAAVISAQHPLGWRFFKTVRIKDSLRLAGVPAIIYAFQNILILTGTKHLDGLSLNLINQTKTIFSAIFVYLLLGRPQSPMQCVALAIMFGASVLLTGQKEDAGAAVMVEDRDVWLFYGVLPVFAAAVTSGLAGALSQLGLQGKKRDSHLFSMELAVFSMATLLLNLVFVSNDLEKIQRLGFFHGWTPATAIPIFSSAVGGIVVGLVVKHAGVVAKGFAILLGIVLTAVLEVLVDGHHINTTKLIALPLVLISTYLHMSFPVKQKDKQEDKKDK